MNVPMIECLPTIEDRVIMTAIIVLIFVENESSMTVLDCEQRTIHCIMRQT